MEAEASEGKKEGRGRVGARAREVKEKMPEQSNDYRIIVFGAGSVG